MSEIARKMPSPRPAVKTEIIGPFRCTPADKDEILRRAEERNMDVTAYITDAALGRLDESFVTGEELWRETVNRRLDRLETLAYGTD
jgi:hypothetical protein